MQTASGPPHQSQLLKPVAVQTSAAPNVTHGLFKKKKTEPEDDDRGLPINDLTSEDVLPIIREVVSGAEPVNREEAIRTIAQRLGAERVGSRIREVIESALNAASRRSIIYSNQGGLLPDCRTIDDYTRDDLKNVLRAVIGRTWTEEDDAIRAGARYLGFRRTGSQIERAFRSAINGGIRQGVLERDGRVLRTTTKS
jgi:hypothetical protein